MGSSEKRGSNVLLMHTHSICVYGDIRDKHKLGIGEGTRSSLNLCNVDPIKPHFYIVKLGCAGVCIIVLISAQEHRLWVLVKIASPRQF